MSAPPSSKPPYNPTIAEFREKGVIGLSINCRACMHPAVIPFERLGLPEDTRFHDIKRLRRFRCQKCGSTDSHYHPDWAVMHGPSAVRRG